jgi:glycerophosphoryl diester phosphodiesterase
MTLIIKDNNLKIFNKIFFFDFPTIIIKKIRLLIFFLLLFFSQNSNSQNRSIIAHRGVSSIAPENTLSAFKLGIDFKFEYIELDIHKSKDDSLMVIHDLTVDRTTNGKGEVKELTYLQLKELTGGFPQIFQSKFFEEKIPTLAEVLKLTKNKIKVCIELKVNDIEKQVVDLVEKYKMEDQVIIFSFYEHHLLNVRALNPNIKLLYLVRHATNHDIVNAIGRKYFGIGIGKDSKIDDKYYKLASKFNLNVWVWTLNDNNDFYQWLNKPVKGLITGSPQDLKKILQENEVIGETGNNLFNISKSDDSINLYLHQNYLLFTFPHIEKGELFLITTDGKVMMKVAIQNIDNYILNISSLKKGLYIANINNNENNFIKKFYITY